jgi:hypothetical protein
MLNRPTTRWAAGAGLASERLEDVPIGVLFGLGFGAVMRS